MSRLSPINAAHFEDDQRWNPIPPRIDPQEIWTDLFGSAGGRSAARTGENLQFEIEVTLEEAFSGGERRFTITAPDNCPTCHGTGAEPGAKVETCPQCKGSGRGTHIRQPTLPSSV